MDNLETQTEVYWSPMVPELTVTDFTKSMTFYCDILGFDVRYQRSEPDFAYLELEKVQIMLESIHKEVWQTGELVSSTFWAWH